MNVNKAGKAEVAERRAALIRLRRTRTPYDSPEILALGYATPNDARKDFYRAVTARRKATEAEVADYREEQNVIFEALLDTYLPLAIGTDENGPDYKAADIVHKTLERQAKVNGWEAVFKAELTGANGGPLTMAPASLTELEHIMKADPGASTPEPDTDEEGQQSNEIPDNR